jgi:hypothetical protein
VNEWSFNTRITLRIAVSILAVALAGGCHRKPPSPQVIINGRAWQVELALTPEQHAEGLAHRSSLAADSGMLFVFDQARPRQFWMRNCQIALDVAFISADRKVVSIRTMYPEPGKSEGDLATYNSGGDALYALEVAAGELDRAGVKPGQAVIFSPDIPASTDGLPHK